MLRVAKYGLSAMARVTHAAARNKQLRQMLFNSIRLNRSEVNGLREIRECNLLAYMFLNRDKSKSQILQDLWVCFCLKERRNGFFVEFGATNGITNSNTWLLEKSYGWRGILAEPNPLWHRALEAERDAAIDFRCVSSRSGQTVAFLATDDVDPELSSIAEFSAGDHFANTRAKGKKLDVETVSLNDLLATHRAPSHIDYMSIDTEGSEFEILSNFYFEHYEIDLLSIEINKKTEHKIDGLLAARGFDRVFGEFSQWDGWYIRRGLNPAGLTCAGKTTRASLGSDIEKTLPVYPGRSPSPATAKEPADLALVEQPIKVAMLLSCASFEGFFGWVQGQTRQSYLERYRHDWAWYYAQGLLENGVTPILYIPALYERGKYQTDTGVAVRFVPLSAWYRLIEQVWVKRFSRINRWSLYIEERINTIAFMKGLLAGLAEDNVDLLYVQEFWSGRFDHLAASVKLPVVAADHGGVAKTVVKLFKRRAFHQTALCYGQTQQQCETVAQYGGNAELQPNGCDTSIFYPDDTIPRDKTILTIVRLTDKQKRTSDLIRALTKLPEEWTLDIVGTGPDQRRLEKLAADLDVSPRVRFRGFVSREPVRDYCLRCGVYCMPSANEAVALAALEAMACGAAVVLSRIPAFEQLVADGVNGHLVPVGKPEQLAAAILSAWERREELGRAAAALVREKYDKRKLYAQLARSLSRAARSESVRTNDWHARQPTSETPDAIDRMPLRLSFLSRTRLRGAGP